MDFVYVDDVARANVLALGSDTSDDVFNVATGVETSLNELARVLARVMGRSIEPEYAPPRRVNAVPRRLASVDRAAERLGFRAAIPLEDGLGRLVAWWREQRVRA
jgi:UDP-glucose 4-epimerase